MKFLFIVLLEILKMIYGLIAVVIVYFFIIETIKHLHQMVGAVALADKMATRSLEKERQKKLEQEQEQAPAPALALAA